MEGDLNNFRLISMHGESDRKFSGGSGGSGGGRRSSHIYQSDDDLYFPSPTDYHITSSGVGSGGGGSGGSSGVPRKLTSSSVRSSASFIFRNRTAGSEFEPQSAGSTSSSFRVNSGEASTDLDDAVVDPRQIVFNVCYSEPPIPESENDDEEHDAEEDADREDEEEDGEAAMVDDFSAVVGGDGDGESFICGSRSVSVTATVHVYEGDLRRRAVINRRGGDARQADQAAAAAAAAAGQRGDSGGGGGRYCGPITSRLRQFERAICVHLRELHRHVRKERYVFLRRMAVRRRLQLNEPTPTTSTLTVPTRPIADRRLPAERRGKVDIFSLKL